MLSVVNSDPKVDWIQFALVSAELTKLTKGE